VGNPGRIAGKRGHEFPAGECQQGHFAGRLQEVRLRRSPDLPMPQFSQGKFAKNRMFLHYI